MEKFKNRKERIAFIEKKKGRKFVEFLFPDMTDKEVKAFFRYIYPAIKDLPDLEKEPEATCIRCGCEVEHHFDCLCGFDRAVFSEEDWRRDLEENRWSDMKILDEKFVADGFKLEEEEENGTERF